MRAERPSSAMARRALCCSALLGVAFNHTQVSVVRSTEWDSRSEEHTSELQSLTNLVCRLLLQRPSHPRPLHSFPTRRSSDLPTIPSPLCSMYMMRVFCDMRDARGTPKLSDGTESPLLQRTVRRRVQSHTSLRREVY